MTLQEIYTKVRRHLLTQKAKALRDQRNGAVAASLCVYRAGSLKCAVGCLIPDEKYSEYLEKRLVTDTLVAAAAELEFSIAETGIAIGPQIDLTRHLQEVHDDLFVTEWKDSLDQLAIRYGLKVEPDETT